jgi:hypothetical protein
MGITTQRPSSAKSYKLVLLLLLWPFLALTQPMGHQRIYLEFIDGRDTIDFVSGLSGKEIRNSKDLYYKNYRLTDISHNATGFNYSILYGYIYKVFMNSDHHLQIIKNKTDTMEIELLGAFNVYFQTIRFQKGHFRFYVNDGHQHKWNSNTLPFKALHYHDSIYDLTPRDWTAFQVAPYKTERDYYVSTQFKNQNLLAEPVAPEDDPNFRNRRRVNTLRLEVEDYNFDGLKDYREQKMKDTTKWNYFIYRDSTIGYELDNFLSKLDRCYFDFTKRTFQGATTKRVNPQITQTNTYEYINGKIVLVQQLICEQAFPNSEKMDCSLYVLENGELIFKKRIKGAE